MHVDCTLLRENLQLTGGPPLSQGDGASARRPSNSVATTSFDGLLNTLADQAVDFLMISGATGTAHGSARLTQDLDVVYGRSPADLDRLVPALAPYRPYPRGVTAGLPFPWDRSTLARCLNFPLTAALGGLDLFGEIPDETTFADPHQRDRCAPSSRRCALRLSLKSNCSRTARRKSQIWKVQTAKTKKGTSACNQSLI